MRFTDTDVQKMYNSVLLNEDDWQENLDIKCIPEEKVIKTRICVKSNGNQAERALRMINTKKISQKSMMLYKKTSW